MRRFLVAALVAAPALGQPLASEPPAPPPPTEPPTLEAASLSGEIDLDGRLEEPAWATAAAASEATEARVLYDADAIYVGMRMHDSEPDGIRAPLGRRDADLAGDWAIVALGSHGDGRTAFVFFLNPAGVQRDLLIYDDVREDASWDAVWAGAASRDAGGWTAEFRIPLSQLRYAGGQSVQDWGLQFARSHLRTGEEAFWAPMSPEVNGMVSQFGTLAGLESLRPPRQMEVVPYVASSLTQAPQTDARGLDPFYSAHALDPRLGVDVKYGLASDLTLTATVNPDFGQVEADPARVNLGGYELSLDERRPFFVEGTDVFTMQPRRAYSSGRPDLLYTRRIGRAPQRGAFVPGAAYEAAGLADRDRGNDGVVYADAPGQSTILGAAKLSGRLGRFSVGLLDAVTAPEYGLYRAFDASGAEVGGDRALVEPATNFAALRARGTFGRTLFGVLGTNVVRSTADAAIASALPAQATVLGLDVEHPVGEWLVSGQLAGSYVSGSADAIARLQTAFPRLYQRPDAAYLTYDPTRTSLAGLSGEVNVLKTSGEHWRGGVQGQFVTPGFDANGLGFQNRADNLGVGGTLVYQQNQAQGPFQRYSLNLSAGSEWTFGGDNRSLFVGASANGSFRNFWGGRLNVRAWPRTLGDRTTRGGPLTTDPAGVHVGGNLWSDGRKPVSGFLWGAASGSETGGGSLSVSTGAEVRPSSSVLLSVGPEASVQSTPRQFVTSAEAPGLEATFGRRYVFAALEQATLALGARLNWTFTPTLSLQTYVRPFVSRGRYSAFAQMTEARQLRFPVYGEEAGAIETGTFDAETGAFVPDPEATAAYRVTGADGGQTAFGNPSFTVRSLQGSAVMRWEYRPGSTLFLVWQQQRFGDAADGRFDAGRELRGLASDPVTNVFLIKLSYWLG